MSNEELAMGRLLYLALLSPVKLALALCIRLMGIKYMKAENMSRRKEEK